MATEQPRIQLVSSLYRHATILKYGDGGLIFTVPERLPYIERDDTTLYVTRGGEYLWDIAIKQYGRSVPKAWDLWQVIAEFQPEPIQDSSLPLAAGKELYLPSVQYINEVAFGDSLANLPVL